MDGRAPFRDIAFFHVYATRSRGLVPAVSRDRVHVRARKITCARLRNCNTFGCVIKRAGVTRAACIIRAALRHRPPHSQSRILGLFVLSAFISPSLFSIFSSLRIFHSALNISHERSGRSANILVARHVRMKHARQFHRPDKICLRNIYRRYRATTLAIVPRPSSVIKLNFPATWSWRRSLDRPSFSLSTSPCFNNSARGNDIDLRLTFATSRPGKFNAGLINSH